jgi:type II secretory pathway component PulJ
MTLVEMMVALTIFAVAMTVIFSFLLNSRRTYSDISDRVEYQQTARATLSLITQEIRSAGCNPGGALFDDFVVAGDDWLHFQRDLNGNGVIDPVAQPGEDVFYLYQDEPEMVWRRGGDGAGWQVLLRNVTAMNFTYFDEEGNQLGPGWLTPEEMAAIRSLEINISGEADNGEPVNYGTRVSLRNG